jgi:hypothetical protein
MTLLSDGTTQSELCGGPLQLAKISDDSYPNIQSMFWFGRWEPHGSLVFQLRFLKAGPAAVLQAVIGLVSRSRDQGGLELCGWMVWKTNTVVLRGEKEVCFSFFNKNKNNINILCSFIR